MWTTIARTVITRPSWAAGVLQRLSIDQLNAVALQSARGTTPDVIGDFTPRFCRKIAVVGTDRGPRPNRSTRDLPHTESSPAQRRDTPGLVQQERIPTPSPWSHARVGYNCHTRLQRPQPTARRSAAGQGAAASDVTSGARLSVGPMAYPPQPAIIQLPATTWVRRGGARPCAHPRRLLASPAESGILIALRRRKRRLHQLPGKFRL